MEIFDSPPIITQHAEEVEVFGVVYFEDWDIDDLLMPLHVVAVYSEGVLKSVTFPLTAAPEDWLGNTFSYVYALFYNRLRFSGNSVWVREDHVSFDGT